MGRDRLDRLGRLGSCAPPGWPGTTNWARRRRPRRPYRASCQGPIAANRRTGPAPMRLQTKKPSSLGPGPRWSRSRFLGISKNIPGGASASLRFVLRACTVLPGPRAGQMSTLGSPRFVVGSGGRRLGERPTVVGQAERDGPALAALCRAPRTLRGRARLGRRSTCGASGSRW